MKKILCIICLLIATNSTMKATSFDFQNTKFSDVKRIELLLHELTLEEKINLLSTNLGVPRLGIPRCGSQEGLHGLALGGPAAMNGKKKVDGKEVSDDRFTTIFPQAYGLGETWDRTSIRKVGNQMAEEARYYFNTQKSKRQGLVIYAPNADLARDPRWGRTEESYGEDPYLTGELTVAMVKGIQGDNPRYRKAASLMKHFLANSNEDGRDSSSSNFDNRLFREYYSYPFYKGITEGGSRAFMASYNAWNGITMCVNPCLKAIARQQWGNNGIICTDGGALKLLVAAHHAYPNLKEGAAAVVKASVGQFLDQYKPYIEEALKEGLLTEKDIDEAIKGNLFVALKLGLLDGKDSKNPYNSIGQDSTLTPPFDTPETRQLVREITTKSIVLLKNNGLLPLDLNKIKKIALIGPYADQIVYDWYSGTAPHAVTILEGLRKALKGTGIEVLYAKDNTCGKAELLAKEADVVLVCTGNHPYGTKADWFFCPVPSDGREAVDRKSLQLPDEDLLRQLHAINPNTALILVSSFPYAINWSNEHLPAILHLTHCSEEQGTALSDVLLGKANPAGRTTQTWVKDILDLPHMMDYDIRHGRTYMYQEKEPLYPFGYGLSYTHFSYTDAKVYKKAKNGYWISLKVKNDGERDGDEVVQVYATFPDSKVEMPKKKLCGFDRVSIAAGTTKEVKLYINKRDLSYWDEQRQSFVEAPGKKLLLIGASSEDIRTKIEL
ncbi:MAG TPA: beta-glucosidase [Prevotella sp.]|nr:beta-glucosidase [Candidatus Segatella violae]